MVFFISWYIVDNVNFRPNFRAQKTSFYDESSEKMAIAVKMIVDFLERDGVSIWDSDIKSFCSEPLSDLYDSFNHGYYKLRMNESNFRINVIVKDD